VTFTGFVLSLAAQAGALLEAAARGDAADLRGVRTLIAVLGMLQDKTHGRRTAEEDQVIEGVLYELRMAYLEQAKVSGA
jgi:hypothetical protein